jgi:hypothetical protein
VQVVINKKLLLLLACHGFFIGRLSWVQFGRLVVLTWPFPVSFEYACMAVVQQYEAYQQQQQRQYEQQRMQEAVSAGQALAAVLQQQQQHTSEGVAVYGGSSQVMIFCWHGQDVPCT